MKADFPLCLALNADQYECLIPISVKGTARENRRESGDMIYMNFNKAAKTARLVK